MDKSLVAAEGPRDLTPGDVTKHIAVLSAAYRCSCADFENRLLSHARRQQAFEEMQKAIDLIIAWKGVRRDIITKSKGGGKNQKVKLWL